MVLPAPATPITTTSGGRPSPIGPPPSSTGEAPAPVSWLLIVAPMVGGAWLRGDATRVRAVATDDLIAGRRRTPTGHEYQRVGGRRAGVGARQRPARGGFVRDRITAFTGALTAGCAVLCIAVLARPGTSTEHVVVAAGPPKSAEQIYLRDCATCHGADARGTALGPDLHGVGAGRDRLPAVDRAHAGADRRCDRAAAASGLGLRGAGSSPTEVRRRHPARPRRLHRGPRRRRRPTIPHVDPNAGNLADGGTVYRLQCAACHAWSGDGGALLQREAPSTHPATPDRDRGGGADRPGQHARVRHAPRSTTSSCSRSCGTCGTSTTPTTAVASRCGTSGRSPRVRSRSSSASGCSSLAVRWIGTRS